MKKICIVTGSRAEYGLLKMLINEVNCEPDFQLILVVTGMHLSPEFGLTYQEVEEDGILIHAKVETLMSSDTAVGITKSIGIGLLGFADLFERENPDMVILLGDRYESLSVAVSAMIAGIPIAHIHGGELTEGAIDDAIRHSITKMSMIHFTSTEEYRKRVIQLGEEPCRVYNVGALGVENILHLELLDKSVLENEMPFLLDDCYAVITFHPVTLEQGTAVEQFQNVLVALEETKLNLIFTKTNADTYGRVINELIDHYVQRHADRSVVFTSMGQLKYLSVLKYCAMVIGNSSSGIIEAPSFKIPTINIGDRQKGRLHADSVIDCDTNTHAIRQAIKKASSQEFLELIQTTKNPYEGIQTSKQILVFIKKFIYSNYSLKKHFYDLEHNI